METDFWTGENNQGAHLYWWVMQTCSQYLQFYETPSIMPKWDPSAIRFYRNFFGRITRPSQPIQYYNTPPPVSDPMETLFTAAKSLLENKIHRLPVVDPRSGNTLYIITHKRILNFIYPYLIESNLDPFFDDSIQELGIGTYEKVKTVSYTLHTHTSLYLVLVLYIHTICASHTQCNSACRAIHCSPEIEVSP